MWNSINALPGADTEDPFEQNYPVCQQHLAVLPVARFPTNRLTAIDRVPGNQLVPALAHYQTPGGRSVGYWQEPHIDPRDPRLHQSGEPSPGWQPGAIPQPAHGDPRRHLPDLPQLVSKRV